MPAQREDGRVLVSFMVAMLCLAGCRAPGTRMEIVDLHGTTGEQAYFQPFDECWFRRSPGGALDIIARRRADLDPGRFSHATQVLHIRTFYEAIPGRSPSHKTMTNALVSYVLVGSDFACSYDGAGFISWQMDKKGQELKAILERSALKPQRTFGADPSLFVRPTITAALRANRDDRRLLALLHEMQRTLGPLPDTPPPITDPGLR